MDSSSAGFKQGSSVVSFAPVNFIFHHGDYFLVGEGSFLSVYHDKSLECVVTRKILNAQNVHGIRQFVDSEFIVFGNRYQRRVELVAKENQIIDVRTVGPPECLGDWIWDLKVLDGCEVLLVSHNRLIFLCNDAPKRYVDCAIACILYSGRIAAESLESVLVASGTVFNEVLLWNGNTGEVWHRLKGHDGVIFSITIATDENILVTTSDDRSARIYKLENGDFRKPETIVQATFTEAAVCYGHSSRVWKASLWKQEIFATVGEDGNLCLWRISDGSLLARKQMPFKSSIASICIHEDVAYLGGAYGCFAAINIDELVGAGSERLVVTLPRLDDDDGGVIKNVTIDRGKLVSSDSKGNYALHCMEPGNTKWNNRFFLDECRDYSVMGHVGGYLFTGCKLGIVVSFAITDSEFVVWDTQQIHSGQIFSVVPFINHKSDQVYVLTSGLRGNMLCTFFCQRQKTLIKLKSLVLPIAQQRWATCAVHFTYRLIVVGDRQGNVLLYSISLATNSTQPLSSLLHLHGSNGTTDLQHVQDRILSCGRNGCIFQLDVQNDNLVILRKLWTHSPMSWVAKLLVFEDRLFVAGFIADDFVVCDPESDYVLWTITAKGSAHKPWDCGLSSDRLFFATANRIDGGISYEHIDIRKKMAKVARLPLHRKKINCVHALWSDDDRTVIVTGGEDNIVILSEVRANQIRPVVRLYEHISSIKAVDSTEICNEDRLLVTCGGRAQLSVWWVTADLSVKLMDQHFVWNLDRNSKIKPWKTSAGRKLDPLTRYMAVGIRRLEKTEPPRFHITTACSDGGIRLFDYVLDGKLAVLKHIIPNDFCQQQSLWHRTNSGERHRGVVVNAATNGFLTCYDPSKASDEPLAQPKQVHQSGVNAAALRDRYLATGGDDNALVVTEIRKKSDRSDVDEAEQSSEQLLFEIKATMEKAHSAQITAVHWWTAEIIMTVAIDQRVSWWNLTDSALVSCAESIMTCIADISGATVLGNNDVLVVGQGAQIIRPDRALVKARVEFLEQTIERPEAPAAAESAAESFPPSPTVDDEDDGSR